MSPQEKANEMVEKYGSVNDAIEHCGHIIAEGERIAFALVSDGSPQNVLKFYKEVKQILEGE